MKYTISNITRALRLPFISASILPFVFGSLIDKTRFNWPGFFAGFIAVVAVHLGANLINDYADAKSGVDSQDKRFYGFFGGSKLIQENIFSRETYLFAALFFFSLGFAGVIYLAFILESALVIFIAILVILLAFYYSHKPLELCYKKMGEPVIFILFGIVPVAGGYFIQTGIFPDLKSFILSLPFGFLTTAILFSNEVPDFSADVKCAKMTWVSISQVKNAHFIYSGLMLSAFLSVAAAVLLGYLKPAALSVLVLIIPAIKARRILRLYYDDKERLVESSKLTINIQTFAGIILILALLV